MLSHSPSEESSKLSDSFIEKTFLKVIKVLDKEAKPKKILAVLKTPVRKLAHFTEYFILGILMFSTLKCYGVKDATFALIICIIYACTDEVHQYFIPGRACRLFDVFIDSLGSFFGILILTFFR
jgi:VanZ family protein